MIYKKIIFDNKHNINEVIIMAKNMYQKRTLRKEKVMSNDNTQQGCQKKVINCEIVVYTNYLGFAQ